MSVREEVLKEIEEQVEREIQQILSEAEGTAKKILNDAEEEANRIRQEEVRKRLSEERRQLIHARLESKRIVSEARQEALDRVMEEVENRIKKLVNENRDKYREVMKRLLVEAISSLDGEKFLIHVNERDRDLVKRLISEIKRVTKRLVELHVSERPVEMMGGVIVETADGKQIFNNTLDARLIRAREELLGQVREILLGSGSG